MRAEHLVHETFPLTILFSVVPSGSWGPRGGLEQDSHRQKEPGSVTRCFWRAAPPGTPMYVLTINAMRVGNALDCVKVTEIEDRLHSTPSGLVEGASPATELVVNSSKWRKKNYSSKQPSFLIFPQTRDGIKMRLYKRCCQADGHQSPTVLCYGCNLSHSRNSQYNTLVQMQP